MCGCPVTIADVWSCIRFYFIFFFFCICFRILPFPQKEQNIRRVMYVLRFTQTTRYHVRQIQSVLVQLYVKICLKKIEFFVCGYWVQKVFCSLFFFSFWFSLLFFSPVYIFHYYGMRYIDSYGVCVCYWRLLFFNIRFRFSLNRLFDFVMPVFNHFSTRKWNINYKIFIYLYCNCDDWKYKRMVFHSIIVIWRKKKDFICYLNNCVSKSYFDRWFEWIFLYFALNNETTLCVFLFSFTQH